MYVHSQTPPLPRHAHLQLFLPGEFLGRGGRGLVRVRERGKGFGETNGGRKGRGVGMTVDVLVWTMVVFPFHWLGSVLWNI